MRLSRLSSRGEIVSDACVLEKASETVVSEIVACVKKVSKQAIDFAAYCLHDDDADVTSKEIGVSLHDHSDEHCQP